MILYVKNRNYFDGKVYIEPMQIRHWYDFESYIEYAKMIGERFPVS